MKHAEPMDNVKRKKEYTWATGVRDFLIFFVIFTLLSRFVLGVSKVKGPSMEHTLEDGKIVFILRTVHQYQVGDVVAARVPTGELFVKRIVARGGDQIEIRNGVLFVNGEERKESYIQGSTDPAENGIQYPYIVPEGSYFLMGDNRQHSLDSRAFGAIMEENLIGRLLGY